MKFSPPHSAFLCLLMVTSSMAFPVDMLPEHRDLIEARATTTSHKTKGRATATATRATGTRSSKSPLATKQSASRSASASASATSACPSFSLPKVPSVRDGIPNSYFITLTPESDIKEHLKQVDRAIKGNANCPDNGKVKSVVNKKVAVSLNGYCATLTDRDLAFIMDLPEFKKVSQNRKVSGSGHNSNTNRLAARSTGVSWNLARLGKIDHLQLECHKDDPPCATQPFWKVDLVEDLGKDIFIYVVDTGVNEKHKQFEGRVKEGDNVGTNCNSGEGDGHGTQVMSVALGTTVGVAAGAKGISIKVFNHFELGSTGDLILGIDAAIQHFRIKQQIEKDVVAIMNISIDSPNCDELAAVIEAALDRGIHVTVAAGNTYIDRCDDWVNINPIVKDMINVGATTIHDKIASFSNFGSCVDISAGGEDVFAAKPDSNNAIEVASGTSFAAPQIAGIIAGIISQEGNSSPAEMKKKVLKLGVKGKLNNTGDKPGTPNLIAQIPESWKGVDGSESESDNDSWGSFQVPE